MRSIATSIPKLAGEQRDFLVGFPAHVDEPVERCRHPRAHRIPGIGSKENPVSSNFDLSCSSNSSTISRDTA